MWEKVTLDSEKRFGVWKWENLQFSRAPLRSCKAYIMKKIDILAYFLLLFVY
jgi:hypothetical protein